MTKSNMIIRPVKLVSDVLQSVEECDETEAVMFGVYELDRESFYEWVADFDTRDAAQAYIDARFPLTDNRNTGRGNE